MLHSRQAVYAAVESIIRDRLQYQSVQDLVALSCSTARDKLQQADSHIRTVSTSLTATRIDLESASRNQSNQLTSFRTQSATSQPALHETFSIVEQSTSLSLAAQAQCRYASLRSFSDVRTVSQEQQQQHQQQQPQHSWRPHDAAPPVPNLELLLNRMRRSENSRRPQAVLQAFQQIPDSALQQANEYVKTAIHMCVLNALARLGRFREVLSTIQDMREQGISISAAGHRHQLVALAHTGQWQEALSHLRVSIPDEFQRVGHFVALGSEALALRRPDIAQTCLDAIPSQGRSWDSHAWSLALRTQAALRQSAQVQRLVRDLKQSSFKDFIQARTTAISSLLACRLLQPAAAELTALLAVWHEQQEHAKANWDPEGAQAYAIKRHSQHRHLMQACHAVVHAAERAGDHTLMQCLLDAMQKAELQPDTAIHNSMLRAAFAKGANAATLQSSVDEMEQSGARPDEQSITILLRAHAWQGDAQGAAAVMARLLDSGCQPSLHAFNALLEAWAGQNNFVETAFVYRDMKRRGITPDLCTYIALFQSLWNRDAPEGQDTEARAARAELAAEAGAEEADRMQKMEQHMYHQMCDALGEQLDTWVADMQAASLQHSPASFTALVQAYGRLERVSDVVHLLIASPELASAQAFNAAVGACARQAKVDEAYQLRAIMEQAGIAATAHTFTALMNAHLRAESPAAVLPVLTEMQEAGVQPTSWTYTAIIKAHLKLGDVRDAMVAVDTMQGSGIMPNTVTWDAVIEGARQQGNHVLQQAAQERVAGNSEPWQQLAQTFTYYSSDDDDDSEYW